MRIRRPTELLGVGDAGNAPRRPQPRSLLIIVAMAVVIAGLVVYLTVSYADRRSQQNSSQLRATGIPSNVSTSLSHLMGLSAVPTTAAPDFTLTDQQGKTVSLTDLRGRAVVLQFMDPICVDICPIVSQEFVDAYHDLGALASHAVFIAVNVNPYHLDVPAMAAYSKAHQLDTIPSWHFLTGSVSSLQAVWRDYNVQVDAPNATADVIHTSVVYFIDPAGNERYAAFPSVDHTASGTAYLPAEPLAQWGLGIAAVARSMSST